MKLLIVFSSLCLVIVTSEQEEFTTMNLNTIPKLEQCPESIYSSRHNYDRTFYSTVCSVKDLIGYLPSCGDSNATHIYYGCEFDGDDTTVTMYNIYLKEHTYVILQRTADLRKIEPNIIIEKTCEKVVDYPNYCTLKYA